MQHRKLLPITGPFAGRIQPVLTLGDFSWMEGSGGDDSAWIIGAQIIMTQTQRQKVTDGDDVITTVDLITERTKLEVLYTAIHERPIRLNHDRFNGESMFELNWDDLMESHFKKVVQPDQEPCFYPDAEPAFAIGDLVRIGTEGELLLVRGIQWIPPTLRESFGQYSAPASFSGSGFQYHWLNYRHPNGVYNECGIADESILNRVDLSELKAGA